MMSFRLLLYDVRVTDGKDRTLTGEPGLSVFVRAELRSAVSGAARFSSLPKVSNNFSS